MRSKLCKEARARNAHLVRNQPLPPRHPLRGHFIIRLLLLAASARRRPAPAHPLRHRLHPGLRPLQPPAAPPSCALFP
eukprot:2971888-Pyramimonas_sp.AAC.1